MPNNEKNRVRSLAKIINIAVGEPYRTELYNCLRTAVYGLPGNSAVQPSELVHELARVLGKPDPSSAAD